MIRIERLEMSYPTPHGRVEAVKKIDLSIDQGMFFTLLGPSGCGKTSTLRCVAGLERPDAGRIFVGENLVCAPENGVWVPPSHRKIGMVFQSYAIWPHMSVFDNVAYPLRRQAKKWSRTELAAAVRQSLALVQLEGLEDRPAPFLSGGQQQRLALARALVAEPRVLLLDEPLSNLDAKLREHMRLELRDLVKRLNVTTLFVTHEQIEALTMSDIVAVMKDGEIVQAGSPTEIYQAPNAPFVAQFIGKTNILPATVLKAKGGNGHGQGLVDTPVGKLMCRLPNSAVSGQRITISVRPESIVVDTESAGSGSNRLEGRVVQATFLGDSFECVVSAGDGELRIKLGPSDPPSLGDGVTLHLPAEKCQVLPS